MSRSVTKNSDKNNFQYHYSTLETGSIRLLRISSEKSLDNIHCTIVHKPLQHQPEYDALSYTWGSAAKDDLIFVDPQNSSLPVMTLPVTRSCFDLLKLLRNHSLVDGEIWIDAVCINQTDEVEKVEQVQLMGEIYKCAKRVLVYPGYPRGYGTEAENFKRFIREPEVFHKKEATEQSKLMENMRNVLELKWFGRTWVLQEVLLARRVEIIIHSWTSSWISSWTGFTRAADIIIPFGIKKSWGRYFKETPPILGLTQSIDEGANLELYDLLKRTRILNASDKRDKIYGLLGIAAPNPQYGPLVQYGNATVGEVYAAFARVFIMESGTLHALSSSAEISLLDSNGFRRSCQDIDQDLQASWAPNWSLRAYTSDATGIAAKGIFNANAGIPVSSAKVAANWKDYGQDGGPQGGGRAWNILVVQGRRLGRISLTDRVYFTTSSNPLKKDVSKECRLACATAERCWIYRKESAEHVCFRTLNFHLPIEQDSMEIERLSREFWKNIDDYKENSGPIKPPGFKSEPFCANTFCRKICTTDSGYFCLVPRQSNHGDLVCCLAGGSVPYVLRQSENGNDFKLVGECYIHGVMQGEALRGAKLEDLEVFELS